jgi:hypothetical protein
MSSGNYFPGPVRAVEIPKDVRMIRFIHANGNERQVVTRPSPFQAQILATFGVDTSARRSRIV